MGQVGQWIATGVFIVGCLWFIYKYGKLTQQTEYQRESSNFRNEVRESNNEIQNDVESMSESDIDGELNSLRVPTVDN